MKEMTLYQISDEYKFLLDDLYNHDTGEIDENVMARLNNLADSAQDKCINITKVFKEFEKEYKAVEEERKRMAKREKAFKNQIDRLKNYLKTNMEACDITKIECPQFVISLQKNPPSVEPYDKSVIPDEYKKITVEYDIQKMKYDMMTNGVVIPGARLVQGNSVRIR